MVSKIFLGKYWHWASLALATALLWYCGSSRLHVISFNSFIMAMIIGTIVLLFVIVRFHRLDEQVTRDKLVAQAFDPDAHKINTGD